MAGYVPVWTPELQASSLRFFQAVEWRVAPYLDADDLLQEAYLCFLKLRRAQFSGPDHFRRVMHRCNFNLVHRYATKRTRRRTVVISDMIADEEASQLRLDELPSRETVAVQDAPVQRLLQQLVDGRCPPRRQKCGDRMETLNEFLCRVAGVDPHNVDMEQQVLELAEVR